jgi:hypothetical protein
LPFVCGARRDRRFKRDVDRTLEGSHHDRGVCHTPIVVLMVSAPLVLALQPIQADARGQPTAARRTPTYEQQQEKINTWTVGLTSDRGRAIWRVDLRVWLAVKFADRTSRSSTRK